VLAWHSINGRVEKTSVYTSYIGMSTGAVVSNLHIDDPDPIRVYAVNGDISGLNVGTSLTEGSTGLTTYYLAGKETWLRAGRDVFYTGGVILNTHESDVSMVYAGRDIIYANYQIAGPGTLLLSAGRNIYQGSYGNVVSLGAMAPGDLRPGAGVVMQAGVGAAGPDYAAITDAYLNPNNLAQTGVPLADQPGKVAKVYTAELMAWLTERYGFRGTTVDDAFGAFTALSQEQQNVFLRQVYFAELRAGGREYNDASSSRFGSYLRGRQMIATLFPDTDPDGDPIQRKGDITMFAGSGVRTNFGGDIQLIAPAGQILVGMEGLAPPATAGVVTQGAGSIQMYSRGSILLGLSRVMTTFGGDILMWSAEGDINAGRGAKTTVLYTPPRRVYDNYGSVLLSPTAPSSGAGIATLAPIPEVPPGDVDLIAPLGTIDAGEAGIRVSGNVNLAALQILNAANIQVQGTSSGIPTVQAPSISAALSTSNATAATQQTTAANQGSGNERPSVIIVEVLGYGGGDGDDRGTTTPRKRDNEQTRSNDDTGSVRVIGSGPITQDQLQALTDQEKMLLLAGERRRQ
jgi:hypothetical protein